LRFNFTHETKETALERISIIEQVEKEIDGKFQLMMDIE
jgi:pyruvate kinase